MTTTANTIRPNVDLVEREADFVLRADLPGVAPDAISLTLEAGELLLEATADAPPAPEGTRPAVGYHGARRYARRFRLGDGVDGDRIDAALDAGVLTVTLPKAEALRPRQIPIATD